MEKGSEKRRTDHPIDKIFVDRWSPRAMSGEAIAENDLMVLFEAARWAPSSYNNQPWRILYARRGSEHWLPRTVDNRVSKAIVFLCQEEDGTMTFMRILPSVISGIAAVLGVAMIAVKAGSSEMTWEEPIKVASGEAHQGPWRMNESDFRYVDDPTVAITEEGAVGVAWVDQSRKDIFFQVYEPDGGKRFEEPVNVSRSPKIFSWLPKLVLTAADPSRVYLLWQEIVFPGGTHGGEMNVPQELPDIPIGIFAALSFLIGTRPMFRLAREYPQPSKLLFSAITLPVSDIVLFSLRSTMLIWKRGSQREWAVWLFGCQ